METLRSNVSKATTRELSVKERAWMDEIEDLEGTLFDGLSSSSGKSTRTAAQRFAAVQRLATELLAEVARLPQQGGGEEGGAHDTNGNTQLILAPASSKTDIRVPSEIRRTKFAQVKGLLERETAMIESVKARLERLRISLPV
jgi:nucleoporin NUP82